MVKKIQDKKRRNIFLSLLIGLIIPLILIGAIVLIILQISGVDTAGWAKEKLSNTPVVSNIVSTSEEDDLKQENERMDKQLKKQRDEIEDLKKEVESLENIKEDLEMDIKKLENKTQDKSKDNPVTANADSVDGEEITEEEAEIKKVAASFRKMDPEKAAKIVEDLDQDISVQVLQQLSGEVRGDILAEMNSSAAASLMSDMMP